MPRFVILEHDHPERHWDFMLEAGDTLRTWRLTSPPRPGEAITATPTFDHRPMYLDYEGPVSGGRGRVVCRERGHFDWQLDSPREVVVRLNGECLRGVLRLAQIENGQWGGEFQPDQPETGRAGG